MKLLLRRDQRAGMLGKQVFGLEVRADLTPEEKSNVAKYRLGETVIYKRYNLDGPSEGGITNFMAGVIAGMNQVEILVSDLERGRRIECKSIIEMIGVEEIIKEAATNFKAVLQGAAKFGGEEVIEI